MSHDFYIEVFCWYSPFIKLSCRTALIRLPLGCCFCRDCFSFRGFLVPWLFHSRVLGQSLLSCLSHLLCCWLLCLLPWVLLPRVFVLVSFSGAFSGYLFFAAVSTSGSHFTSSLITGSSQHPFALLTRCLDLFLD